MQGPKSVKLSLVATKTVYGGTYTIYGGTYTIRVGQKKVSLRCLHVTSSNTGRFSKFFHCHILQKICKKAIIKHSTSPQTCRYTTLWNTLWVKKNMPPYFCPYLRQILTDFKNSFTGTLCGKFAIKWLLIIPPHLNSVAALPCETLMSVKLAIAAVHAHSDFSGTSESSDQDRSRWSVRHWIVLDLSLWIPEVLTDVFVADLPSLIPVY